MLTRGSFVPRDGGRRPRVTGQAEGFHHAGSDDCRSISYSDHPIDGSALSRVEDGPDRSRFVVETNRQGVVMPWVVEHVAPVGREDQVHTQTFRGFSEGARLITGRSR
jgi:hypothetical protein